MKTSIYFALLLSPLFVWAEGDDKPVSSYTRGIICRAVDKKYPDSLPSSINDEPRWVLCRDKAQFTAKSDTFYEMEMDKSEDEIIRCWARVVLTGRSKTPKAEDVYCEAVDKPKADPNASLAPGEKARRAIVVALEELFPTKITVAKENGYHAVLFNGEENYLDYPISAFYGDKHLWSSNAFDGFRKSIARQLPETRSYILSSKRFGIGPDTEVGDIWEGLKLVLERTGR